MPILTIHIIAGLLAIAAGAVALYATKGSTLHRGSGMIFAMAMLTMTSSAVVMAAFLRPNIGNVIAGLLTFYLVSTGLLTVLRSVTQARALLTSLMFVAMTAGALAFIVGSDAVRNTNGMLDGIPVQPMFVFGAIAILAALLDARMLWAGSIQGKHRLARHLWRMGLAMWIATASFFLGQPKVFPEALRHAIGLRAIPVVLVLIVMLYWLARVFLKRQPLAPWSIRKNFEARGPAAPVGSQ